MARITWWMSCLITLSFSLLTFPAAAAEKVDLALGESVFKEICFSCHGLKGDGKGPNWTGTIPRPQVFANPDYMSRMTEQYMVDVVKYGKLAVLKKETPPADYEAVAMPSFEDVLDDDQIKRLIEFEKAILAGKPTDPEIREIFNDACAVCHGKEGRGDGERVTKVMPSPKPFVSAIQPPPADYTNQAFMERFPDDYRFWLIKKGKIGVTEEKGFDTMLSYGHILSDDEIRSVIHYVRETFILNRK